MWFLKLLPNVPYLNRKIHVRFIFEHAVAVVAKALCGTLKVCIKILLCIFGSTP